MLLLPLIALRRLLISAPCASLKSAGFSLYADHVHTVIRIEGRRFKKASFYMGCR